MRRFSIVQLTIVLFSVCGCVHPPEFREDIVTTTDVMLNIKCELRSALLELAPETNWMTTKEKPWIAGFTVTLKVFNSGGLTGDASVVVPLNPGTFTIGLTAGGSTEATRTETFDFSEKLNELIQFHHCPKRDENTKRRLLLSGSLGFQDLLNRTGKSRKIAKIEPTSLAYNLDFVLKKSGNAKPRFSLIPLGNDQTFGGGLTLEGSRTKTHKLAVAFTPVVVEKCKFEKFEGKCPALVAVIPARPGKKGLLLDDGTELPATGDSTEIDEDATQRRLEILRSRNATENTLDELRSRGVINP